MTVHKAMRTVAAATKAAHVHQMLGVVIIVAHASEIARVVMEINIWHLATALTLFSIWMATTKGGLSELA